jgi:thiol-disulfide isomerase/thioredoxin
MTMQRLWRLIGAGAFLLLAAAAPSSGPVYTDLASKQPIAGDAWRGRWTLMSFWAWWCGPCLVELRGLPALVAANPDVHFVTAAMDSRRRALDWLARNPVPGATSVHIAGAPSNILRSLGDYQLLLPFNMVIDPQGRVCASSVYRLDAGQLATLLAKCRRG